jgi:hypothetical protein
MPIQTIFYSWQSDLPNSINRGFIQDCLERAIGELKADEELELDPCLDRDTSGVPGSPDIAATIFEKIRAADIFVGDVTFIDKGDGRRTPNPNVLIELGYAASCLAWDRIICVFNTAGGSINDLPFDLRQRRVVPYQLTEGQGKGEQRKALAGKLRAGIESILYAPDHEAQETLQNFLSSLASELIPVLMFGEEFEQRRINPWLDSARFQFQSSADSLRETALTDVAKEQSLDSELEAIADLLDSAANLTLHRGSWPQLSSLVEQAVEKAKAIKAAQIDTVPLSDESAREVHSALDGIRRKLDKLASRAQSLVNQGRFDDVQGEASELGQSILRIGYYNIDCIQHGLGEMLRQIGHDLHLVETMRVYMDGGRSASAIVKRIQKGNQSFGALIEPLSKAQAG